MTILEIMMCRVKQTSGVHMDMIDCMYFEIPCIRNNVNSCRHIFSFFGGDPEWYL